MSWNGWHVATPLSMWCVLAWQLGQDGRATDIRCSLAQALLRAITEYSGLTQESQRVRWFWKVVEKMAQRQRSRLLRFATGSVRVCGREIKENAVALPTI